MPKETGRALMPAANRMRDLIEKAIRWRDAMTRRALIPVVVMSVGGLLLAGCGSAHTNPTKTASSGSAIDNTVGEQVKKHLEGLNHGGAGIKSVSCIQRGPVPSMGTDAVAFLCSIQADNGEVAKPELWASLPMDEENKVELLDETAERELAARGEVAGLNDDHSESANKSAEEDIKKSEETVRETSQSPAAKTSPTPTTGATTSATTAPTSTTTAGQVSQCEVEQSVQAFYSFPNIKYLTASHTTCQTANGVAMEMKVAGSTQRPSPRGPFSLSIADGEQRFRCEYRNLHNAQHNYEEGELATCDGPNNAVVTMRLSS
jgi:hypothetical protein